jgi:serine/threonine protein kinase
LKLLKNDNIVNLREIITYDGEETNPEFKREGFVKGDVFMVLDYIDHDLSGLLEKPEVQLTDEHICSYTKQLLEGVFYMHKNKILHRDIKTANILVTKDNVIKIADWGLARSYNTSEQSHKYTNPVVTLWYRAPELLLGLREYGFAIDMWSVGCVFAEMKCKGPIFKGKDEVDQLSLIYQLCGSPGADVLEVFKKYAKFGEVSVAGTYEKSFKTKHPG